MSHATFTNNSPAWCVENRDGHSVVLLPCECCEATTMTVDVDAARVHIHVDDIEMLEQLRDAFDAAIEHQELRAVGLYDDIPPARGGGGIIYCAPVKKEVGRSDDGEEREKEYLLLRNYTVFCADQVEGAAADRLQVDDLPASSGFIDYEPAERAAAVNADMRFGGDRAYYRRPTPDGHGDFIQMPHKHQFPVVKEYYATLLHELGHWSESRLGWTGSYAEGELRAEMASAFAHAELGVPQSDDLTNHESYLASWAEGEGGTIPGSSSGPAPRRAGPSITCSASAASRSPPRSPKRRWSPERWGGGTPRRPFSVSQFSPPGEVRTRQNARVTDTRYTGVLIGTDRAVRPR